MLVSQDWDLNLEVGSGSVLAEASSVTEWINAISQLTFVIIFLLLFLGFNQKLQVFIWSRNIRARLAILESLARESRDKIVKVLGEKGLKDSDRLVEKVVEYFVIQPVEIEPIDIIKRLEHVFRTRESRLEGLVEQALPSADRRERSLILTSLEILLALNYIFKYVRHLLLTGRKTNNWLLIMQLEMLMPQIMRFAQTYRKALDVFMDGKPIGDGLGPLVAFNLAKFKEPREIAKDTVYYTVEIENRKAYVIKARGPESNVGHPGVAVEKLVRMLNERNEEIGMIITVDAALKLEGEETGSIAEGAGAAIGDPGPEKIRIERVASEFKIPLHAIVVKMSMEEAILEMKKEIAEAVPKVIDRIKELAKLTQSGKSLVIVGIGNTVGIS
uniref:DUF1512 domain-containing protein n=1 Tax=Fervidicoccus fontis TaxID=683846 RepID=A0A7J3ZLY3_9CREN